MKCTMGNTQTNDNCKIRDKNASHIGHEHNDHDEHTQELHILHRSKLNTYILIICNLHTTNEIQLQTILVLIMILIAFHRLIIE